MTAATERKEPMSIPGTCSTAARSSRRALIALAALLLWVALAATPAQASFDVLTKWGGPGSGEGQFHRPEQVATDAAGNVYVADADNDRIQKFTASGDFLTKWGSLGSGDGQFNLPELIATDAAGNVYVADSQNDRIQKFTASGVFLTKWGSLGSGDGQLNGPAGVATDPAGDIYVSEAGNDRIQKFTASGLFLLKFGSAGSGDGQFDSAEGIATDCRGNVYVADANDHRIQKFGETTAPPPPCTSTPTVPAPAPEVGGGGTAPGPLADTAPPGLTLAGARRQRVLRQRGVIVFGTSSEAGKLAAAGRVSVPKLAKVYRLKPVSRMVAAGQRTKLYLKLPKKALVALRRALADGKRSTAKLTITATDSAGNRQTATRRVTVVR